MSTPILKPEAYATITVDDTTSVLQIDDGKVTLDDGVSPYVQAEFDVPLAAVELVEQINPMLTQRVVVNASDGQAYIEDPDNPGFLIPRS